jgi:galactan beta-1,4-galactosyltransferase
MKPNIRKESGGGGGSTAPSISLSCFDLKPFIATLAVLTFLLAVWQLQPYESFLPSRLSACVVSSNTTSHISISNHSSFGSNLSFTSLPPSNSTTNIVTQIPQKKLYFTVSLSSVTTPNLTQPTINPIPADPNRREFRPYGNAAALFVQMGAYRGGPRTFAIVGLASKPIHVYGSPYFKCEWVPQPTPSNPNSAPIRTKAYKILPDWGYGRVYTVVVVNCTFPSNPNSDNAGGALVVHAYYSTSSRKYEKFVALEEAPGSYNEAQFSPPYKYEHLYCGSSLYGDLNPSRLREWMAYHTHFFGPKSHFVFHDAGGIRHEVRAVLEPWVKAGRLTIQDIRAQSEYDGYYYNQFLVVNDCLHRYRYAANWTFFFDVDEYLYLPTGESLETILGKLKRFTQFTIEQNPMSSKLCALDSSRNYSG